MELAAEIEVELKDAATASSEYVLEVGQLQSTPELEDALLALRQAVRVLVRRRGWVELRIRQAPRPNRRKPAINTDPGSDEDLDEGPKPARKKTTRPKRDFSKLAGQVWTMSHWYKSWHGTVNADGSIDVDDGQHFRSISAASIALRGQAEPQSFKLLDGRSVLEAAIID